MKVSLGATGDGSRLLASTTSTTTAATAATAAAGLESKAAHGTATEGGCIAKGTHGRIQGSAGVRGTPSGSTAPAPEEAGPGQGGGGGVVLVLGVIIGGSGGHAGRTAPAAKEGAVADGTGDIVGIAQLGATARNLRRGSGGERIAAETGVGGLPTTGGGAAVPGGGAGPWGGIAFRGRGAVVVGDTLAIVVVVIVVVEDFVGRIDVAGKQLQDCGDTNQQEQTTMGFVV